MDNLDMNRIPEHIAIIMDGNGRWATERGKQRSYGHQAGVETVRRITSECTRLGVKYLTLYTFSTENWNRPADEIAALMGLVLTSLEDEIFMKNNVRFRVIGDIKRLPQQVQDKLQETMDHTAKNDAMTMVVALSYSSRWEIVNAMKETVKEALKSGSTYEEIESQLTEQNFEKHLDTSFMPDPDLLIRTGAAHQQLPALADSLLRVVFLRYLLARLRRGRPAQGHRKLSEPPTPLRQDRGSGGRGREIRQKKHTIYIIRYK